MDFAGFAGNGDKASGSTRVEGVVAEEDQEDDAMHSDGEGAGEARRSAGEDGMDVGESLCVGSRIYHFLFEARC